MINDASVTVAAVTVPVTVDRPGSAPGRGVTGSLSSGSRSGPWRRHSDAESEAKWDRT